MWDPKIISWFINPSTSSWFVYDKPLKQKNMELCGPQLRDFETTAAPHCTILLFLFSFTKGYWWDPHGIYSDSETLPDSATPIQKLRFRNLSDSETPVSPDSETWAIQKLQCLPIQKLQCLPIQTLLSAPIQKLQCLPIQTLLSAPIQKLPCLPIQKLLVCPDSETPVSPDSETPCLPRFRNSCLPRVSESVGPRVSESDVEVSESDVEVSESDVGPWSWDDYV